MSSHAIDALSNQLSNTTVAGEGVSFVGKSLKLNNAEDAKVVTDAIKACTNLEFLNLEGNTLGVEAAKAIGNALGAHPELKRALWKDMFTGRMKDEIPQALRYLGSGLDMANVRLVELDLSDNAFGPIGMEGLASLLRSSSCYSLQILRLNNNGLGITGAKLLARALMDCYEKSKAIGNPLPLRVFIAGRNRLENEGVTALSAVFKVLKSLEEIQIPQNGIYHRGIKELSEALKHNQGLRILNLNDNTLSVKGSMALAAALPELQLLQHINLGDCLLKTNGALSLAGGLQLRHTNLEELILDHNEIKKDGGLAIAEAMGNKKKLKLLVLDGNQFGSEGVKSIKAEMKRNKLEHALGSFEENESENEDDDDEDEDGDEEETEDDNEESGDSENESEIVSNERKFIIEKDVASIEKAMSNLGTESPSVNSKIINLLKNVTAADFLQYPSPERFLALQLNKAEQIISEVKKGDEDGYLERILTALMKVSSLCTQSSVSQEALDCSNGLYQELFSWGQAGDNLSLVNNSLLVHLGLIKGEDKKWKPEYNQIACHIALKKAMQQNYFPQRARDTILCFLQRKQESVETVTIS